jgi:hypothetical protein
MKFSWYAHWAILTTYFSTLTNRVESSFFLRGAQEVEKAGDSTKNHRELIWIWEPPGSRHTRDPWYDEFDEKTANESKALRLGDEEDFLRSYDVCPSKEHSDFSRSYCSEPPDCNFSREWGKAKLCINRVPSPWDRSKYYVLAMKCIPDWENCDKCVCGIMNGDTCDFNYSKWSDDHFQLEINCDDPKTITMKGRSYTPNKN